MLTKENLGEKFKGLARVFPGIPSYQEREGLRTQDKVVRAQLAARIEEQVKRIDEINSGLVSRGVMLPLAKLDRIGRKLMRLADTIRFASYGYAGLFAATPIDERRLMELYDYDLSLHQDIETVAAAVGTLQQQQSQAWKDDSLEDFQQAVYRLEESISKRETLFTGR
ncbi:MAG: hypothetical protein JSU72_12515 [Deltaproteobacteria bacterium]|nr:MAG: hypothetical protein JSU72_12515 [Deltaproteobacteria bacterium]